MGTVKGPRGPGHFPNLDGGGRVSASPSKPAPGKPLDLKFHHGAPSPGLPKTSASPLTETLNALAYQATSTEVQDILRKAAEAAEAGAVGPWLSLRSSGPQNLPTTLRGTVERQLDHGAPTLVFLPEDRSIQKFRLSPADLEGVPEGAVVQLRKFSSEKGQRLELMTKDVETVQSFVGKVEQRGKTLVAVSLDPLAPMRSVPLPGAKASLIGKTVLAHVESPLSEKRFGLVEEVLPSSEAWRTVFLDLAARRGVAATFSPEEKADAAKIAKLFDPEHITGYQDLTDKAFFAVDNPTSKDFDQAMHLEPSASHPGATDVYYAIADVSYFLKLLGPDSALARRAARMQTTTYLPGLDAPVLPRSLSEDLISLVAGQKRPAFVIKYTVGQDGAVIGAPSFIDAVVKNKSNTNYPAVQKYFDAQAAAPEPGLAGGLDLLKKVGQALIDDAKKRGMMTHGEGERWATIDEKTGQLKLEHRGSLWVEDANAQISITANHLIGKYLIEHGAPAFHRVHAEPEASRVELAAQAIKALGYTWPAGKSAQDLLGTVDTSTGKGRAARRILLRVLPRAVVSAEPSAHAGLKLAEYVQSTAPMRRERDRRNHEFVRAVRDHHSLSPVGMEGIVLAANRAQDRAAALDRLVRDRLTAQALTPYLHKALSAQLIAAAPHGLSVYLPEADTEAFIPMRQAPAGLKLGKDGLGIIGPSGQTVGLGEAVDVVVRAADAKQGLIDLDLRLKSVAGSSLAHKLGPATKVSGLSEVRGDGFTSKLVGAEILTEGVVTAVNAIGFYLEAPGAEGGVLVRTRGAGVVPGDLVRVRGTVREARGQEALYDRSVVEISNRPDVEILGSGASLPQAAVIGEGGLLPPPKDRQGATDYWRKLLGKRVIIGAGTAISPSNRFNDLVIVPDGWKIEGHTRTKQGGVIQIEGAENFTKVGIKARENVGGLPSVSVGDRVEGLEGVVTYRSGDFQIELTQAAKVTPAPKPELSPCSLVGTENQVTMASMNMLNMHPGEGQRAKRLAERIVFDLSSPDIIAVQEIQDNDGPTVSSVVDASQTANLIIEKILAAGGPTYAYADLPPQAGMDGGQAGANIRTGYFYRPDRVSLEQGSLQKIGATSPAFESTRKSLVARFNFKGHSIIAVNNHLTSRRGSAPWTADQEELVVGGAEKRLLQGQEIAAAIAQLRKQNPKSDFLVVGDYNDFPSSGPVTTIAKNGMSNLSLLVPAEDRYDYNYRGTLQSLTSVIGNQSLIDEGRIEIEYLHHNSLHPIDDSDHDHVVMRISY
ncbi:MAG: RNB domain-containing ribonuclease [Myxococcota bacterium]